MRKLLLLLLFCAGMGVGMAADQGLKNSQLLVNGNPSKAKLQINKEQVWVPISLPVDADVEEWVVSLKTDDSARQVKVDVTPRRRKVRGENPCNICLTSGKCQNDYPAGSGTTTGGTSCYMCTGTGKCYYCSGVGKW